jgi:nucleoside-diphosphate-sugar epimerase
MGGELILVTGGSGFIGARCILQLLEARYRKKQARHERKGPARPRLDAAVK